MEEPDARTGPIRQRHSLPELTNRQNAIHLTAWSQMVTVCTTYFNVHCTDEFRMILSVNSDYFLKQR
jgi:hypothetical protein